MSFKGRALYNLLHSSYLEDRSLKVEPWQVADYRGMSLPQIFQGLKKLDVSLTEESFLAYAEDCETPEELIDCLWVNEEDVQGHDQTYLLLFELWRRLMPRKQSLSIFGDELDHRIFLYDKEELQDEELLQQSLRDLEDIADQSVDMGAEPEEIFTNICQYCANDIEPFLYDYIGDQMEGSNETYASELIDGFYEYVEDKKAFDFLRAQLFSLSNPKEGDVLLRRLLEQLEEEPDASLLFEICQFLVHGGDIGLFKQSVKQVLPLLSREEEFQSLLQIMVEFYRCLDQDGLEKSVQHILDKRAHKKPEESLPSSDKQMLLPFLKEPQGDEV